MNRHVNAYIFCIGLLFFIHYDIIGFYLLYKAFHIKYFSKQSILIIKAVTVIIGCIIIVLAQYSKLILVPLGFIGNMIAGVVFVYFGRKVTVKSNFFYFQLDEGFFEFWNKNIRGK